MPPICCRTAPGRHRAVPPPACDFHDDASIARLRHKLFCFALRELRSPDLAEDVTQDTIIALLETPGRYRGDARLDVYAIGVLRHKIADHFRSARREVALDPETVNALRDAPRDAEDGDSAAAQDPSAAIEAGRDRDRFWHTLRECLATMPEAHRAAFVLRDIQGWSMAAVCTHLGVTSTHVSVMAYRARAHLQARWPASGRDAIPA